MFKENVRVPMSLLPLEAVLTTRSPEKIGFPASQVYIHIVWESDLYLPKNSTMESSHGET